MSKLFNIDLKGDKSLWGIVILLALMSFLPVFSASSNLVNLYGKSVTGLMLKHFMHILIGFIIMYSIHKLPFYYFRALSRILVPIVIILLIFTLKTGTTIQGANASRWLQIPFVGIGFQTSALASVILMINTARYLAKYKDAKLPFMHSFLRLWMPTLIIVGLIIFANFSTAAILFVMVFLLVSLTNYPVKYLAGISLTGILLLSIFILSAKAFPDAFPNRVDTWISRITSFVDKEESETDSNYQVIQAKTAIATGGITGTGPGKSIQKNFLPQSTSDFIFAIIVEEYGFIGGLIIIVLYIIFLFRIFIIARDASTDFGRLLAIGLGLPIVFQAFINIGVAVNIFPVTGQTLPLISSGGSSIWMTCLAIGIILSVSNKSSNHHIKNTENPLEILRQAN